MTTQINYPHTTIHFSDSGDDVVEINGSGISCPAITPAVIYDATAITPSPGLAGQVLTAGAAGGSVVWAYPPAEVTPSLAQVMAVATAGDAGGQALSNLPSVSLISGSVGVQLSAVAASDRLAINTAVDSTKATKEFSHNYLPIVVGGITYYLPLFSAPA
jgi:hypothetical protein